MFTKLESAETYVRMGWGINTVFLKKAGKMNEKGQGDLLAATMKFLLKKDCNQLWGNEVYVRVFFPKVVES